jgi:hypothetical protein
MRPCRGGTKPVLVAVTRVVVVLALVVVETSNSHTWKFAEARERAPPPCLISLTTTVVTEGSDASDELAWAVPALRVICTQQGHSQDGMVTGW